jgi:cytochrome d ubiquinol oxidase subunit I
MLRFVKQGPSSLHTNKYHFEKINQPSKDEQGAHS